MSSISSDNDSLNSFTMGTPPPSRASAIRTSAEFNIKHHRNKKNEKPASLEDKTPEKSIVNNLHAFHRVQYMKAAYNIDWGLYSKEEDLEEQLEQQAGVLSTSIEGLSLPATSASFNSSKRLTPAKWKHRVHGLKHWNSGDGKYPLIKDFRKAYKDCKNFRKGPRHQEVITNGEGTDILYKVNVNKTTGEIERKRVVHILETFDIIEENHLAACHHLADTTKNRIDSAGFYNITRTEVEAFCDTCPTCTKKRKGHQQHEGAKVHIKSGSFRWLWQLDLVDYREDPQVGHNGVTYKWLLNIKDHFSRFTILRPLPSKEAKHVATELCFIGNLLGYPMLIQTDNGNEFKGEVHKLIEELQQRDDKAICITTGQPRTPRHQGSVERSNAEVKATIAKDVDYKSLLLADRPHEQSKVSWLSEYARSMSSSNADLKTRRLYDITPYSVVFGMAFEDPIYIGVPKEQLRARCSVGSRVQLLGEDYKKRIESLKISMEDKEDTDIEEQEVTSCRSYEDLSLLEDKKPAASEKSISETENVASSFQEEERKPAAKVVELPNQFRKRPPTTAVINPYMKKPKHSFSGKVQVKVEEDEETAIIPSSKKPKEGEVFGDFVASRHAKIPLSDAHKGGSHQLFRTTRRIHHVFDDDPSSTSDHQFSFLEIWCEDCCCLCENKTRNPQKGLETARTISLGDDDYYERCSTTQRWLESDFVSSFAVLCSHALHNPHIYVMVSNMNSKEIIKPDHVLKNLKSSLESVLCVVNESSHFAVIHMSLKRKEIIVYDGLNTGINWRRHSRKLLQRLGEIPVTASITNVVVNVDLAPSTTNMDDIDLEDSLGDYTYVTDNRIFQQPDSSSCGPIACGVLWNRLSNGVFEPSHYTVVGLRKFIVDQYRKWIDMSKHEIYLVRKVGPKMAGFYSEIPGKDSTLSASPNPTSPIPTTASFPLPQTKVESPMSNHSDVESIFSPPTIKREPLEDSPTERDSTIRRTESKQVSDEIAKRRQAQQGEKMEKRYLVYSEKVDIASVVQIKIDKRDRAKANCLNFNAIVFAKNKLESSFKCVTEFGIIGHGSGTKKQHRWMTLDQLIILRNENRVTISASLEALRKQIKEGSFQEQEQPTVSVKAIHQLHIGHTTAGSQTCRCKATKKKCSSCICSKNGRMCSSGCACNGNCCNPLNVR